MCENEWKMLSAIACLADLPQGTPIPFFNLPFTLSEKLPLVDKGDSLLSRILPLAPIQPPSDQFVPSCQLACHSNLSRGTFLFRDPSGSVEMDGGGFLTALQIKTPHPQPPLTLLHAIYSSPYPNRQTDFRNFIEI